MFNQLQDLLLNHLLPGRPRIDPPSLPRHLEELYHIGITGLRVDAAIYHHVYELAEPLRSGEVVSGMEMEMAGEVKRGCFVGGDFGAVALWLI